MALNFWVVFPSTLGTCSGVGVSPLPIHMCFFRSLWSTKTLTFRQFDLGYFCLFCLRCVFVVFLLFCLGFGFSSLWFWKASNVWHLTNFELVLSIKAVFIRLGPDWFVCCSGKGFGREGSHGPVHGEMEKVERRMLSRVP